MLQDLERGRRTEIDAINGALIARAGERGLPCPVNRLLAAMVRAAEG
jgi:2-dehydropantoate 2-reductase